MCGVADRMCVDVFGVYVNTAHFVQLMEMPTDKADLLFAKVGGMGLPSQVVDKEYAEPSQSVCRFLRIPS